MSKLQYVGVRSEHVPNNRVQWYGLDCPDRYKHYLKLHKDTNRPPNYRIDDGWGYVFNSAGFRGEEPSDVCDKRIMVVGDSNTFGTGIKWEQTWPYVFRQQFRKFYQVESVDLLNLAQGGASNDYITRTALANAAAVKPDLLICNFTHPARVDYPSAVGSDVFQFCPGLERQLSGEMKEVYESFYYYYNDRIGFINAIKNILLFQYFCISNGINYFICMQDYSETIDSIDLDSDAACKSFMELLDSTRVFNALLGDKIYFQDYARDCEHPGPMSNEKFGNAVFEYFVKSIA